MTGCHSVDILLVVDFEQELAVCDVPYSAELVAIGRSLNVEIIIFIKLLGSLVDAQGTRLAAGCGIECVGEDIHRAVVGFEYFMEYLRAILAGSIADSVVTINLQYVQILIHLCHPYAIRIFHVANAGTITGSRLVECRLNHRCKESSVAIVDDAGEGDLLTIACDVFRPDGLGVIEFHPIIRDVPEGEGGSVVSLAVGRNLTSNTGQQLVVEETVVGEAGIDAKLTQLGKL